MIELYTYQTPNGQKASIMLDESGQPYQVHFVDLMKGQQRSAQFLRIWPNNKVPAIVDLNGVDGRTTIFESGAILVYSAEKTGKFLPPAGSARIDVMQWLFWAVSGVGPGMGRFASTAMFSKDPDPALVKNLADEVVRLLTMLETRLAVSNYLAGNDYSIADIGAFTWVEYVRREIQLHADLPAIPATDRWLEEIARRTAVRKGARVPMPTGRAPSPRM